MTDGQDFLRAFRFTTSIRDFVDKMMETYRKRTNFTEN
jgi:hypothetical protein